VELIRQNTAVIRFTIQLTKGTYLAKDLLSSDAHFYIKKRHPGFLHLKVTADLRKKENSKHLSFY